MYSQLVLIIYLETVELLLVPGLLSQWVPEVSLDSCVLSARCVSVLILFLCSTTGPLLINLLFTFDEDRTISTNVTNVPAEITSYLPSYLWFIVESGCCSTLCQLSCGDGLFVSSSDNLLVSVCKVS